MLDTHTPVSNHIKNKSKINHRRAIKATAAIPSQDVVSTLSGEHGF